MEGDRQDPTALDWTTDADTLAFISSQLLAAARRTSTALYPGNPKHTTARPTADRLLKALQEFTLMIIREGCHGGYHLTSPFTFQQQILAYRTFQWIFVPGCVLILTNHPQNERTMMNNCRSLILAVRPNPDV